MYLLDKIDMKKSKYILPSLFTSASLLFAFLAIVSAFHGGAAETAAAAKEEFIKCAAYMLLASFADAFDGRVARLTNTQTSFGAALDSLADVVAFGAAPALVMYFWILKDLGMIGAAIAFLYLLAVALRLAKFDTQEPVTNMSPEMEIERKLYFYGMPCPAGAVAFSGLIWLGEGVIGRTGFGEYIVLFLTLFTCVYLAFAMISNIKFRSFKDSDGKGNISKLYVICFIGLILMIFTMPEKLLYLIIMGYALSGPISTYNHYKRTKNDDLNGPSNVDGKETIDG
jgi:CDP-diacylglycerol--serine O-phosphatidyltransferase